MLRRSSLFSKPNSFSYDRAVHIAPSQMFTRDAIVPLHNGAVVKSARDLSDPNNKKNAGRRWMRGANETCIDSLTKSASLLTSYEVSYAFDDPQWMPMLQLPCGNPVSLEVRARHINHSLRHLVQRGHALYLIHKTDHSVVHPRGLAAVSHVVCSLDGKSERLLTSIIHEGPIDARYPDGEWGIVAASDSRSLARAFQRREMLWMRSRRIGAVQAQMGSFDWTAHHPPDVGRDTHSEVMLLKHETDFIGPALCTRGIVSSAHIAEHPFHYVNEFEAPATCAVDVFHQAMHLTAKNSQLVGATRGEQLQAVAWKMRQYFPYNPIELDLPFQVMCGPPQVYRGADLAMVPSPATGLPYLRAKPSDLAGDVETDPGWKSYGAAAVAENGQDVDSMLKLAEHEGKMRTMIAHNKKKRKEKKMSKKKQQQEGDSSSSSSQQKQQQQQQLTMLQFDLAIKQGASEYLYDQGNSSRAPYFWSQKNAMPYESTFWCVRDGLLDAAQPVEIQPQFERMRSRLHTASKQQKEVALRDHHEEKKGMSAMEDAEDEDMLQSQPLEVLLAQRKEMRAQKHKEAGGDASASAAEWQFKRRFKANATLGPFAGAVAEEDPASVEKQAEMYEMLESSGQREVKLRKKSGGGAAASSSSPGRPDWDKPSSRAVSRQAKSKKALERISKQSAESKSSIKKKK